MTTEETKQTGNAPETVVITSGEETGPFWNASSSQFIYAPAFQFAPVPGFARYRYAATDEQGAVHAFVADSASASLAPVWDSIPEGTVRLTVHALDKDGREAYLVGARTFFRLAPFLDDLPGAVRPYGEAASRAYLYAMSQGFLRHWLTDATPDPDYDLNVYPSKMISAIIGAMLYYAELCPAATDDAVRIAENAADYLIGITPQTGPMQGVPPTYQIDFRPHPETRDNLTANARIDWTMMIYPADVGAAYLRLSAKTGKTKYYDAALAIGRHYRETVQENGSWYLLRHRKTGEVLAPDFCEPLEKIVPFLMALCERTGDGAWKTLADRAIAYVERDKLKTYDWGAQFEDGTCSVNYSNLTHYGAAALARYYARYFPDDPAKMQIAEELMRFVEDQFVIWKRPAPWNRNGYDTSLFHTPCGLEQYGWYVPIDASTGDILTAFLALYKAGRGEVYLRKAKALGDSLTRVQRGNGMIPTHWMNERFVSGEAFWINCMFVSAAALTELASLGD